MKICLSNLETMFNNPLLFLSSNLQLYNSPVEKCGQPCIVNDLENLTLWRPLSGTLFVQTTTVDCGRFAQVSERLFNYTKNI